MHTYVHKNGNNRVIGYNCTFFTIQVLKKTRFYENVKNVTNLTFTLQHNY